MGTVDVLEMYQKGKATIVVAHDVCPVYSMFHTFLVHVGGFVQCTVTHTAFMYLQMPTGCTGCLHAVDC
jgi:hypothetical protein